MKLILDFAGDDDQKHVVIRRATLETNPSLENKLGIESPQSELPKAYLLDRTRSGTMTTPDLFDMHTLGRIVPSVLNEESIIGRDVEKSARSKLQWMIEKLVAESVRAAAHNTVDDHTISDDTIVKSSSSSQDDESVDSAASFENLDLNEPSSVDDEPAESSDSSSEK